MAHHRRGVSSRWPGLVAAIAALALANPAQAGSPEIAADFDGAVARIKALGAPLMARPEGLDAYFAEAVPIARRHGPSAAREVGDRAGGDPDRVVVRLAWVTLVVLAADPAAAAELHDRLRRWDLSDPTACRALMYATPPVALGAVDVLTADRRGRPHALATAATLARFYGVPGREVALESALETAQADGTPVANHERGRIRADLVALRQRLARPDRERLAWSRQDRMVWWALALMPGTISQDIDLSIQANAVTAVFRFSPAFLKDRLGAEIVDPLERDLLLGIAIRQPDARFVPELSRMLDDESIQSWSPLIALATIRTREALAPLEKLAAEPVRIDLVRRPWATSPVIESSSRGHLVLKACELLGRRGDRRSLEVLEALAADESRSGPLRDALARARDELRMRYLGTPRPAGARP